jgi:2-acylglycerol O-acyltransferase 2
MDRRMQTLSVVSFWWYMPFSILLFIIMSLFPPCWIILIPYVIFMMYDNAPQRGGRRIKWLREHSWWNYFRDYFPAQLIKEEDLDPSKNYVFGYHPHGIISLGAFANFATEATGFSEQFKGITCSLCTLTTNFKIPFLREFLMGLGAVAVSKKSINHILKSGPGKSVAIVIGGAAESLDARPKTNDLTLKKRKGFVKIALQSGASLVPVFCFGENDLFHQVSNPKGSDIRTKQEEMIKTLGFAVPLFFGRGIFQYSFGLVPIRKPLVAVFGKAIDLPKIENPTLEEVQKYHTIYLEALSELYHRHKGLYASDRRSSINFVG